MNSHLTLEAHARLEALQHEAYEAQRLNHQNKDWRQRIAALLLQGARKLDPQISVRLAQA